MIPALLRQPKAHRRFRAGAVAILSGMGLAGCTHTTNLLNPTTPAFLGSYAATADSVEAGELRVVSFNVKLGRNIPGAISVLEKSPLAGADVIALQEMDERGPRVALQRLQRHIGDGENGRHEASTNAPRLSFISGPAQQAVSCVRPGAAQKR